MGSMGKENDNEVKGEGNQQDYGMRVYDPRIGKFLSVDPIAKSYPWYTPYQFAGNKPIIAMDLDGGEELVKTNWINAAGKVFKTVLEYNTTAQPLQGNAIHKVDNYMDKNGYNYYTQSGIGQLDGTNFRNAIGGYNNSNNNYDFSVVKHDNPFMQWSGPGLMAEFITGTGPENTLVFSGK